jgi:hypothetical protein
MNYHILSGVNRNMKKKQGEQEKTMQDGNKMILSKYFSVFKELSLSRTLSNSLSLSL